MTRHQGSQIPLFDMDAHDEAQQMHYARMWRDEEYVTLQVAHKALQDDYAAAQATIARLTKERDALALRYRRLETENRHLAFQLIMQQPRRPSLQTSMDINTLLLNLLKLSHPDRWSQGQHATDLAHEITIALNAARQHHYDDA